MSRKQVTILVPHYRTPQLTKLCLRLLRKYTDPDLADIIVIDNDSQDGSDQYLETLPWITFIRRQNRNNDPGYISHGLALDLALERVTTPFVLSIHTDTLVKRHDWLEFLLTHIQEQAQCAGVGSWKLEVKPWYKRCFKAVEAWYQSSSWLPSKYTLLRSPKKNRHYLRGHCALYRTDLLKKNRLSFADGGVNPGEIMHHKLVALGYTMQFIAANQLLPYIEHVNHATLVLNPQLGSRRKTILQGNRRLKKVFAQLQAEKILADETLDR